MKTFRIENFTKSYTKLVSAATMAEMLRENFPRYNWSYNAIKGKAYVCKHGNAMDAYFVDELRYRTEEDSGKE